MTYKISISINGKPVTYEEYLATDFSRKEKK